MTYNTINSDNYRTIINTISITNAGGILSPDNILQFNDIQVKIF